MRARCRTRECDLRNRLGERAHLEFSETGEIVWERREYVFRYIQVRQRYAAQDFDRLSEPPVSSISARCGAGTPSV